MQRYQVKTQSFYRRNNILWSQEGSGTCSWVFHPDTWRRSCIYGQHSHRRQILQHTAKHK